MKFGAVNRTRTCKRGISPESESGASTSSATTALLNDITFLLFFPPIHHDTMFGMITLLRKIFIKDYTNLSSPTVREKHGLLASIGGIIMNLLLFGFKLLVGILSLSISIISDAINNLTDMFSCIVNLIGFKIASKPADKDHPYGHERVEYITGMIVSFIIIAVAIILGYSSIMKIINQEKDVAFTLTTFIILGVAIIAKILLGLYYYRIGKLINSLSLKATMQDSINDAICTTGVLISSIFCYFFPNVWFLDPIVSIFIALFILYSGIKMVKETSDPLIGITPDHELVQNIVKTIKQYNCVIGIHDLVFHSYGPTKMFMSLHVEVDGYANMILVHDEIDNIEHDIFEKYGVQLTIHLDPIDTKNEEIPLIKNHLDKFIKEVSTKISYHDLRLVYGPTHTNVLFDIVVSYDEKKDIGLIKKELTSKIMSLNDKYRVVITVDRNYI